MLPAIDNEPDTDSVSLAAGGNRKGKLESRTFTVAGGNELVGVAFKVIAPEGYSGNIEIMVGVEPAGTVTGVEILSQAETPGLGARITEPAFKDQFAGKSLRQRRLAGEEGWRQLRPDHRRHHLAAGGGQGAPGGAGVLQAAPRRRSSPPKRSEG